MSLEIQFAMLLYLIKSQNAWLTVWVIVSASNKCFSIYASRENFRYHLIMYAIHVQVPNNSKCDEPPHANIPPISISRNKI